MKKITLFLGAALLFAGSAHAQLRTLSVAAPTGVGTAPAIGATRGFSNAPAPTGRPALGSTGAINNDSYVQQVGEGQMANVSQTGTGHNTADIEQSPSRINVIAPGGDGNYASQTQVSTGSSASGDQNKAYIGQFGAGSTAIQEQTGTRNQAAIRQGNKAGGITGLGVLSGDDYASQKQTGNDNKASIAQNTTIGVSNNSATQEQRGNNNNASASQEAQGHTSVQKQGGVGGGSGNNNNATVTQRGLNQYASQNQQGNDNKASVTQQTLLTANNQAIQAQTGDFNRATITQSTSNNFASQAQSGGNSNYAETVQGGNLLRDSAYSVTTQQGSNNPAIVHQGVQ